MNGKSKFLPILLFSILALVWGSSFILMKKGMEVFAWNEVSAIRLIISAICMFPFLFRFKVPLTLEQKLFLFLSAILGNGIPAYLFTKAETIISSAVAGILNSLTPIFTLVIGIIAFQAGFNWKKLISVLIGLVGAIILISAGGEEVSFKDNILYSGLVILAAICYGLSANIIKHKLSGLHPLQISSWAITLIGIPSGLYLVSTDVTQSLEQEGAMMALGFIAILAVLGTAYALVLFNQLVIMKDAVYASMVAYVIPIVALGWGILYGEKVYGLQILGMIVILGGMYLANSKRKKSLR